MTTDQPNAVVAASSIAADVGLALVCGWAAYALSCWLVPALDVPISFGEQWQRMSEDPFSLYGQFPHRILTPLLAWMLGFGGESYLAFTHGLHVLMLASVFVVCRRLGGAFVDGCLVVLAVAITAPVQMYKEKWVGYVDPLSYTLFLCSILAVRRPYVFWALFLCNLLNHELAAFLLPWLWFLRRRTDARWKLDLVCAGVALAAYAGFYFFVKSVAEQKYSVDYFLQHPLFPGGTLAVWFLAIVHWVVAFGPLLAVLAWHQHRRGSGAERWHLWLVLAGILSIFCIAWDWARHSNLILLPLVFASVRLLATGWRNRAVFAGLLVLSASLFAVPTWRPWSTTAWPTQAIANAPLLFKSGVVVESADKDIGFGPLSATLGNWLPVAFPVLWPVLLIAVFIWSTGAVYARVGRPSPA